MDAFSEILNGIKLNGALFFNAEFSAPWGFAAPASRTLAPALAPGAPHLVIYHFVIEGAAAARTIEGQSVALEGGDVVVLPHGDPHFISSGAESSETTQTGAVVQKVTTHDFTALRIGGGGEITRFVCGFMACDPYLSRPILGGLPPIFKVNIRTDLAGHWLESSILHLVDEAASGRLGSEALLAKLSEARCTASLRCHSFGKSDRLARGSSRSHRRKEPGIDAHKSQLPLDHCRSGERGWDFPFQVGGTVYTLPVRTPNHVSHPDGGCSWQPTDCPEPRRA